ncbi:MAG: ABC transporter substrate-binding protein [Comamonas sp.]|nr:ABC transporter substrate-binding protein [Comamonas sp.]
MQFKQLIIAAAAGAAVLASTPALADRLQDIQKAGVLRVAAFDANPPFGFADPKTRKLVGLDVDYAQEFAQRLGVKLQLVPTNPANRVPLLLAGKVDLVLANFTITEERAKQVNFSIPYFASGTQFIAPKGQLTSAEQLNSLRIGVDKGTTNEIVLREKYPQAQLVAYDDTPFAFTALRNGNVQAISQDGPKLVGLLATIKDQKERAKWEVPAFTISSDYIGVGIPKGETALTDWVNTTLKELEAKGQAGKIYDTWFGPQSNTPLQRNFKIGDKL